MLPEGWAAGADVSPAIGLRQRLLLWSLSLCILLESGHGFADVVHILRCVSGEGARSICAECGVQTLPFGCPQKGHTKLRQRTRVHLPGWRPAPCIATKAPTPIPTCRSQDGLNGLLSASLRGIQPPPFRDLFAFKECLKGQLTPFCATTATTAPPWYESSFGST